MIPSPYDPGSSPRYFAGRTHEQETLRTRFAKVAQFGEYAGPLIVFHGPRGVGKTSLLRAAQHGAEELGLVTAWTACRQNKPFMADVADRVVDALARHDGSPRKRTKNTQLRLREITAQLGVPGASLGATFERGIVPSPARAPMSLFEDLLGETAQAIRSIGGAGLLLFIDELHAGARDDLSLLLNVLQNLEGRREDIPLSVATAGLPSTPDAIARAATFGERGSFYALGRLADVDAIDAIQGPARSLDVRWDDDALLRLITRAQGYPFLVQLLADVAWSVKRPEPGQVIDVGDLRRASLEVERRLSELFELRWNAASPGEQSMLVAMAAITDSDAPVERRAVAERMSIESRRISVTRDRLIGKGIIEPVGHGRLRFTIPGFSDFVRALA